MLGEPGDTLRVADGIEWLDQTAHVESATADAVQDSIRVVDIGLDGLVDGTAQADEGIGELRARQYVVLWWWWW